MGTTVNRWVSAWAVGLGLLSLHCSSPANPTTSSDAGALSPPVESLYEVPTRGEPGAWGAVPFPNDLYLDDEGKLWFASLPVGPAADPLSTELMIQALHDLDGAGLTSPVFFPVSGPIDPATLPGQVVLVDLEGAPAITTVPTDTVFREDMGLIVCALEPGVVLRRSHRYGAYVLEGVRGLDGRPLASAPSFAQVRDLSAVPTDRDLRRAQESLRPLLERMPVSVRAQLVTATVFRTENLVRDTLAMRDAIHADPPAATFVSQVGPDDNELVALLGEPEEGHRGVDNPGGLVHDHIGLIVQGTIGLPSFLHATPGTPGLLAYDAMGHPQRKGIHEVPFTVVLPRGLPSYANLPVVVFQHGINGSRMSMLVVAEEHAAQGMATLGVDLLYHGSRYVDPRDERNDLLGTSGPDGFGDKVGLLAASAFFQLTALGDLPAYDPRVQRENLRAAALDLVALAAWVQNPASPEALAAHLPGPYSTLSFRKDGVGLSANSFGSMVGGLAVAIEPGIHTAGLFVPPAGFPYPSLVHSPNYGPTFTPIVEAMFDIDDRVVPGDPVLDSRFDPMFALYNTALERGDPLAYAPTVVVGELRGQGPSLLVSEAYSDEAVSNDATEAYAKALGLSRGLLSLPEAPPAQALRYVELVEVPLPLAGNVDAGDRTAALLLWHPATHGLAERRHDVSRFEPGFPPFVLRPQPIDVINFVDEAQRVHASFLADGFSPGAPVVFDPFAP
jgi:hypothetical protein